MTRFGNSAWATDGLIVSFGKADQFFNVEQSAIQGFVSLYINI